MHVCMSVVHEIQATKPRKYIISYDLHSFYSGQARTGHCVSVTELWVVDFEATSQKAQSTTITIIVHKHHFV